MAYRISFDSDREAGLFDSKLGGLPYWDFSGGLEYPLGADGKRMQLLFQINFDDDGDVFADDDCLPHSGMLQFFISSTSGSYGLSFDGSSSDFRVVYHGSVNRNVTKEDLLKEDLPKGFDDFSTPARSRLKSAASAKVPRESSSSRNSPRTRQPSSTRARPCTTGCFFSLTLRATRTSSCGGTRE